MAIYVDDMNLVGTATTCKHVMNLPTNRFEMKLLDKTSYCLGLQVAHLPDGSLFLHETAYIQKVLKRFGMDKANPLSAPMISRSRIRDDSYHPSEEEEKEFSHRTRYLAAVGALLYLSNFIWPDISFIVSVLAQHN